MQMEHSWGSILQKSTILMKHFKMRLLSKTIKQNRFECFETLQMACY